MTKKIFLVLTLIYIGATWKLVSLADDNYFGPDRKGTIIISLMVYVVIFLLTLLLIWIKKNFKK